MTSLRTIYLDYAAASPVDPAVLAAMQPYFSERFYNPSSPYAPAVAVRREYQQAKDALAHVLGARADELTMTAGATESINLAMNAAGDGQVVTSAIEHPAVLEATKQRLHTIVGTNAKGYVAADEISSHITPDTQLVSIGYANNELGTVQPLKRIAEVVAAERQRRLDGGETRPIWLHTDASQAAGMLDLHVGRLGVDMLTLNSGKCYGPKQVGLLWARTAVSYEPFIFGGGQELGRRSGTENVAGVVGFATALQLAERKRAGETKRLATLRQKMQKTIQTMVPNVVINSQSKHNLPSLLHISFPGLDAERLVFALENEGVYVATGSACSANKATASHVLTALDMRPELIAGSMRISLGRPTTESDINEAAETIARVVNNEYKRVSI